MQGSPHQFGCMQEIEVDLWLDVASPQEELQASKKPEQDKDPIQHCRVFKADRQIDFIVAGTVRCV